MSYELTARIKHIGETETFKNDFTKRNLILEDTSGQYTNLYCIELTKDKTEIPEQIGLTIGQMVNVKFNIRCNEWNGKYFTSLNGVYVQQASDATYAPPPPVAQQPVYQEPPKPPQPPISDQPDPEDEGEIPF